jgi:ATP-dependent Lon protease
MDKLGQGFHGDPSSALLEVLDPEQNGTFRDNYLGVPFDLSRVLFIGTANILDTIPGPLRDRMELIEVPGYTDEEKLAIATRYLVPRQRRENGIGEAQIAIDEDALAAVIRDYTREAGVRSLERELATVLRKVARRVVKEGKGFSQVIDPEAINSYLGVPRYRSSRQEESNEIGTATGLAWTEVGGEILPIEVTPMPGKGGLTLTGKLGDVMKESAHAAMSYVRARAEELGIEKGFNRRLDVHIHVPEGAIPKDGPSAGITMATALVSALSKVPVRRDVAMTGEITLRGKVLPIGGVKEKLLAAHRIGIETNIMPRENEKDLADVPDNVLESLTIELVDHVEELLKIALVPPGSELEGQQPLRPEYEGPVVQDGMTH